MRTDTNREIKSATYEARHELNGFRQQAAGLSYILGARALQRGISAFFRLQFEDKAYSLSACELILRGVQGNHRGFLTDQIHS
jgi:hypothetical protein